MSRYNKLIGALVGNLVAILIAWLAVQFPAVAECAQATDPALPEACKVMGFDQVQITAALMFVVNSLFVYLFPPNRA